jgi:hypothetical protein
VARFVTDLDEQEPRKQEAAISERFDRREWGLIEAADSAQTGGDSAGFRGLIV